MTNFASAPAYGRPGVLLTGATGFLGGYLLKELVERTEMPIYCLTRSDGTLGARAVFHMEGRLPERPLELKVELPGLPLTPVNALLTPGMAQLSGALKGKSARGRSSTPPPCSGISASWNSS